jgi:hypothetical protein
MAVGYNPKIVTNGLIMYVDAANVKSYPGSGTTWFDLSGNANHLTLYNSPTFASRVVQFNGTTQYADNNLNLSTGTSTYVGAGRYSVGSTGGRVFTAKNNNYVLGHYQTGTERFYAEGWVYDPNNTQDSTWRIYTGTHDVTADTYSFYINASLKATNASGSAGPNGISIAKSGVWNEPSLSEVSFVMAYNRVLTPAEITQNFNALRGRFNI